MRDTIALYDASCVALAAMTVSKGWKVLSINEAEEYKRKQE